MFLRLSENRDLREKALCWLDDQKVIYHYNDENLEIMDTRNAQRFTIWLQILEIQSSIDAAMLGMTAHRN